MTNPADQHTPPQPPAGPAASSVPPGGYPPPAAYPPASQPPPVAPVDQPGAAPMPGQPAPPRPAAPAAGFDAKGRVHRTRISGVWIGLITAAVFLILLVVFIAQNTATASIHFLGFNGHMPLGLTILISAIIGFLIAAVPGSIRIMQLRRALKRNTPADQRVGR
jgi:uncharacterized integral membrane protein